MSASDAEHRTGYLHSGTDHISIIDGIAQGNIGELLSAYVSDSGKSCQKGDSGILGSDECLAWYGGRKSLQTTATGIEGQVSVHINKPGQDSFLAEVDDLGVRWDLYVAADGLNDLTANENGLIFQHFSRLWLKEFPCANGSNVGVGRGLSNPVQRS